MSGPALSTAGVSCPGPDGFEKDRDAQPTGRVSVPAKRSLTVGCRVIGTVQVPDPMAEPTILSERLPADSAMTEFTRLDCARSTTRVSTGAPSVVAAMGSMRRTEGNNKGH